MKKSSNSKQKSTQFAGLDKDENPGNGDGEEGEDLSLHDRDQQRTDAYDFLAGG